MLSIILFSNFSDYVPVALVGRKVLAVNQTLKKPPWVRILPGTQNTKLSELLVIGLTVLNVVTKRCKTKMNEYTFIFGR